MFLRYLCAKSTIMRIVTSTFADLRYERAPASEKDQADFDVLFEEYKKAKEANPEQ